MPAALIHASITCATDAAGQTHCSGVNGGLVAGLLIVYTAVAVVGIVAAVKVVTKAGYSGWWVLISFVPLVGIVFVLIFAFSKWPVLEGSGDAPVPTDGRLLRRARPRTADPAGTPNPARTAHPAGTPYFFLFYAFRPRRPGTDSSGSGAE